MALATRVQPIVRDLELLQQESLGPKARSAMLAAFAAEASEPLATVQMAMLGELKSLGSIAGTKPHVPGAVTIFITDFAQKPEMDVAWKAWLTAANFPTRATVGVSNLGNRTLIEMTAIAAK